MFVWCPPPHIAVAGRSRGSNTNCPYGRAASLGRAADLRSVGRVQNYRVVATRSGRWWALEVPGLDMGYSQAHRLSDIGPVTRELISLLTGVAEDAFAVTVRVERGGPPA
jgi:hypothetical protein